MCELSFNIRRRLLRLKSWKSYSLHFYEPMKESSLREFMLGDLYIYSLTNPKIFSLASFYLMVTLRSESSSGMFAMSITLSCESGKYINCITNCIIILRIKFIFFEKKRIRELNAHAYFTQLLFTLIF